MFTRPFIATATACGLLLGSGGHAAAGVADSPLPTLAGEKTSHVFTIPGVLSHGTLATSIVCTSLEKSNDLRLAVEFFAWSGGAPENGVGGGVILSPGGTLALSTKGTTFGESIFGIVDDVQPRSARVVATSPRLACSATVVAAGGNGTLPGVGWSLPVVKKTKQSGA